MNEDKKIVNEKNNSSIEITDTAITHFNLAKNKLTDQSKLALRITSSSRG